VRQLVTRPRVQRQLRLTPATPAHPSPPVAPPSTANPPPPTAQVKLVKGFKGDASRLGPAEKFFLALADVPQARARAVRGCGDGDGGVARQLP
jgi:hypothetical protein